MKKMAKPDLMFYWHRNEYETVNWLSFAWIVKYIGMIKKLRSSLSRLVPFHYFDLENVKKTVLME